MASLLTVSETPLQHLATAYPALPAPERYRPKLGRVRGPDGLPVARHHPAQSAAESTCWQLGKRSCCSFDGLDAATSLMNGAMLEAMRHLVMTDDERSFVRGGDDRDDSVRTAGGLRDR